MGILVTVASSLLTPGNIPPFTLVNNPMEIIDRYYEHQFDEELFLSTLDDEERKRYELRGGAGLRGCTDSGPARKYEPQVQRGPRRIVNGWPKTGSHLQMDNSGLRGRRGRGGEGWGEGTGRGRPARALQST